MEPATLQAFLRVLYTVNNNPQYILAKSSSQVSAIVSNASTTRSATNESTYARAPLKACLSAVCDSSPELLQDPTRDFSLYVLDPLEAQPSLANLAHTPQNTTNSPCGVAVALGLLSWALESNDSTNIFVTGTVIPNAPPALEVIFALRETKRMPKPTLHLCPSSGSISAAGLSQPPNTHLPQAAWMNWFSTSQVQHVQQQQRTLTRSADFPELYIGPPRRTPGRPEGSTSSKSRIKSQSSISSLPGNTASQKPGTITDWINEKGTPSTGAGTQSESKQEVGKRSKQKTKPRPPRPPPPQSPFICEPLKRNTVAAVTPAAGATGTPTFYRQSYSLSQNQTQPYPRDQSYAHPVHNPWLELLSTISSNSSGNTGTNIAPMSQAALLSALQGFITANSHLLQPVATNTGPVATTEEQLAADRPVCGECDADDKNGDADSDIVILDSSTVDATAFRKACHKEFAGSDVSPSTTNEESPTLRDTVPSPLHVSTPPSGQAGTTASSQISTPTATPEAKTPTSKHVSWERTENGNGTPSQVQDILATPTPLRMRKRKLDEYMQDQDLSIPMFPPSPSPSMTRTFGSGRALSARRVPSSPGRGTKSVSSSSMRLPSMLGSMRSISASCSRLQANSSGSSTHDRLASLVPNERGNSSTIPVSGPAKPKAEHSVTMAASLDVASATTSLKRRLNLNLNEVMEEHEARKNANIRKKPPLGCKSEAGESTDVPQAGPSRLSKSNLVSSFPFPTSQSGSVPGAAISIPPATTSLSTVSTLTTVVTKNPLKSFVTPAWARTSTALLPRLSEETLARQRAEREAKKAQVSLRRREAARAKRQRLRGAVHLSSDEDDVADTNGPKPRTLRPPSNVGRSPLPPPSLPVFASDAVAPIPSSPPQTQGKVALPVVPSTPPRKHISPKSVLYRTPNKPSSCSLFTPSGQEPGSLFTPSTPSVTPSLTRAMFTPRSPTVLLRSGAGESPRKGMPQTPKRNGGSHQTLRSGRNMPFASPGLAMRTPQIQAGMGTRTFLLPPPSPCTSRTPRNQVRVRSREPGSESLPVAKDNRIVKLESPGKQDDEDGGPKEEDTLVCESEGKRYGEDAPAARSPTRSTADDSQETSELRDIASRDEVAPAGEEYASSPLPPSSPLPTSPLSSPVKLRDSDVDMPTIDNLASGSNILLPSASESDIPPEVMDTAWLPDDACTPTWLTDSEASAWLSETEAWLTDTEGGGPLLTDSDGAWFSDSDAVFGDMSSLPPSSASNWLSDDADVDTDGEGGATQGPDTDFDTAAFERVFAALVERGGQSVGGKNEGVDGAVAGSHSTGAKTANDVEFWESIRPLLGENAVEGASATTAGDTIDEVKVAQDLQQLLDGLVDTSS